MSETPRKSRDRDAGQAPADLNLVPIMNLVVCLIPIVLLGTSLVQVGTIETELPRLCSSCTAPDSPPLGLRITVGTAGFELRADDRTTLNTALMDLLDPSIAEPEHVPIPRKGESLDFVGLYNALVQLKLERPEAIAIGVNAAEGVPWREVVTTLDVARHRLGDDRYADPAGLAAAHPRRGPPSAAALFPLATLAISAR